jgi:voltage-gated potassium channel
MESSNDRDLFVQSANWLVFVYLIVILSVVNLFLLLLPIDRNAKNVIFVITGLINIIFWVDAFYWLRKLPGRRYLTHYHGRLAFIGNIPIFTPLRLLQLWLFYRKMQQLDLPLISEVKVDRNPQGILLFFSFVAIVIFEFASVLVLNVEAGAAGANIETAGDALWWSFVTVATVGYGDKYPVSSGGRGVAILLMIVGIGMFGVFTSTLGDWFRRPRKLRGSQQGNRDEDKPVTIAEMRKLLEAQNVAYQKSIAELTDKLNMLEKKI